MKKDPREGDRLEVVRGPLKTLDLLRSARANLIPGEEAPNALAGPRVDLVHLADALVEAEGALKLAQNQLDASAGPETAGKLAADEVGARKIRVETARRKLEVLRRMARSALKGAKTEADSLQDLEKIVESRFQAGEADVGAVASLRSRLAQARMVVDLLEDVLRE